MTMLQLIGAITNVPDYRTIFAREAQRLRDAGYDVIDPCEFYPDACSPVHSEGCPRCPTHAEALDRCMAELTKADGGAVITPGWHTSAGALAEIRECDRLGKPVHVVGMWLRYAEWEREESA